MSKFDLKQFALQGATARVAELTEELAAIYRVFPGLRRGGTSAAVQPAAARKQSSRKPMTAAQKKAVSARMKKYWASRRKAKGES